VEKRERERERAREMKGWMEGEKSNVSIFLSFIT